MTLFLKKILLFCFFVGTLSFCAFTILAFVFELSFKNLPPPELTNSYSLNDKLRFTKNKKAAEILCIGSSMSLNNLDSDVITDKLKTRSYLNLSSWGLSIQDNYELLKIYTSLYPHPKVLLISSNVIDFTTEKKKYDVKELKEYLRSADDWKYHLKHFNLKYYLTTFRYCKKTKSSKDFHGSLVYDPYGAVILDAQNFKKDTSRWNSYNLVAPKTELNYNYLDSISSFCAQNNIRLFFINAPIRSKLLDEAKMKIVTAHTLKINKLLSNNHQQFINSYQLSWHDSLFVDATHFNSIGASRYTKFFLDGIQ